MTPLWYTILDMADWWSRNQENGQREWSEKPWRSQFIVPLDYDQTKEEDFRGILDVEMSHMLRDTTEKTQNVNCKWAWLQGPNRQAPTMKSPTDLTLNVILIISQILCVRSSFKISAVITTHIYWLGHFFLASITPSDAGRCCSIPSTPWIRGNRWWADFYSGCAGCIPWPQ